MDYQKNKRQLIYVLLAVVIPFAVYKIASVTILPNISDKIVRPFTGECILTCSVVVAAILVKKIWTLKPTGKSLGIGLLLGWPMLLIILLSFSMWLFMLLSEVQSITVSGGKIAMFLITALLIGISEELLIRGILINGFLDYYGKVTPSSIRKAIMLSSVVFGALHLFNILIGVTFGCALIQAVNAALAGVFYGALYIRSHKNLWPCIILHGVWDLVSYLNSGILMGTGTSEAINNANLMALVPTAIFAVYALFILRNKKLK